MPASARGLRYPLEFLAAELGVDQQTLLRRCEDAGFRSNGKGLKFSEAYDALSLKSVSEAARRRKTLAEAEASEIDTLNKRGKFGFLTDFENSMKDWSTRYRVTVESASYVPGDARKRLLKELHEVKADPVEPSNK